MAKKTAQYGNESRTALKGADRVRKKPAVIFGSDGLEGCQHAVFEIISNSIDEAREGYGKKIVVTKYSDLSIEVQDFGRGVPVDFNQKEQRYNWELLFCELYAGGKYDNESGDIYQYSLGTNGLGLCSTQYASEYMDVEVRRDGFKYNLHFEHGEIVGELQKEPYSGRETGTRIRWKPDRLVFKEIDVPFEYIDDIVRRQAIVNDNILFVLRKQNGAKFDTNEYIFKNGISEHVEQLAGEEALSDVVFWQGEFSEKDPVTKSNYKIKINTALKFTNRTHIKEYYHNSSWLEYGGSPDQALTLAFRKEFDRYIKQQNKYNKNESAITMQDIEECMVIAVSSFSNLASFENQTKKALRDDVIKKVMTDFFRHQLEVFFIENKQTADKVIEQVLINKRSRERSEKERLNIKKTLQSSNDMAGRVPKFVDCRLRDKEQRELFIVEGDSALGSCKLARDPDFQAIMPIRGKILNCLKADTDRIFKSEVIVNLLKVMGCGVEIKSKANKDLSTFDINSLRFNKIIICTDADVDGFHIRSEVLTMIYTLTPTLIKEGYVYIAETPLFEITTKDKTYYAYDEREKNEILGMIGDKKYTLQRSKGLGENQPDMMNLTTMNPATRRLIKVTPEGVEETARMFEVLLGDDIDGRKQFIAESGHLYLDSVDLS